MPTSQNSYPANSRAYIHTLTVPGTKVRLPVRKGPAGDLLLWAATRWHREVEPLVDGWNWGYAERTIRGSSTTLSNHASGTAIDLNAPRHPLGVAASRNLSPAQITTIRRIIADSDGCLRWGGEWSRPDAMHIEVLAPEARCAAVLAKTNPAIKEDDMAAVPQDQWNQVHQQATRLLDYQRHHGNPVDDQLGHTISTRLEMNRRLDELISGQAEINRALSQIVSLLTPGDH